MHHKKTYIFSPLSSLLSKNKPYTNDRDSSLARAHFSRFFSFPFSLSNFVRSIKGQVYTPIIHPSFDHFLITSFSILFLFFPFLIFFLFLSFSFFVCFFVCRIQQTMVLSFDNALPLTRHPDVVLVLDTPKGMCRFFFQLSLHKRSQKIKRSNGQNVKYGKETCSFLPPSYTISRTNISFTCGKHGLD